MLDPSASQVNELQEQINQVLENEKQSAQAILPQFQTEHSQRRRLSAVERIQLVQEAVNFDTMTDAKGSPNAAHKRKNTS